MCPFCSSCIRDTFLEHKRTRRTTKNTRSQIPANFAGRMRIYQKGTRAVAFWVGMGIVMLLIQVMLGGITRLTGSGLSITEWDIITHTIPPLTEASWFSAFEKYQATPQYHFLNTHFTLTDFKYIFFWEWLHRFWAQLIGIFFLIGFIYLVRKKYLKKEMQAPLIALFLFGAMQGAIGWIMVLSGLDGDAIYVKPARLAVHFVFALGLIAYAHWFFLQLSIQNDRRINNKTTRTWAKGLILLLFAQFIFGALIAGHKAATAAPTWPDINGELIPDLLWDPELGMRNLVENKTTIHFIHRTLAYILVLLIAAYTRLLVKLKNNSSFLKMIYILPLLIALFQVLLGILSLLASIKIIPNQWGPFETFALLHQMTGMVLLLTMVTVLYTVSGKSYPPQS